MNLHTNDNILAQIMYYEPNFCKLQSPIEMGTSGIAIWSVLLHQYGLLSWNPLRYGALFGSIWKGGIPSLSINNRHFVPAPRNKSWRKLPTNLPSSTSSTSSCCGGRCMIIRVVISSAAQGKMSTYEYTIVDAKMKPTVCIQYCSFWFVSNEPP